MSGIAPRWTGRAAELRQAFDRSFGERPDAAATHSQDFLAIGLGALGYALRLADIAGLFAGRPITPVPGAAGALLGIVGQRGAIVPVYSLAVWLGHPAGGAPAWLAIAAGPPIGFAFDSFDGFLRQPSGDVVPHDPHGHVCAFIHGGGAARPVVHLASVLDAIRRDATAYRTSKER